MKLKLAQPFTLFLLAATKYPNFGMGMRHCGGIEPQFQVCRPEGISDAALGRRISLRAVLAPSVHVHEFINPRR